MIRKLGAAAVLSGTIAGLSGAAMAAGEISFACNPNGAVLTTAQGETYYLGKSCDAARKGGGTGSWWYAAGAFLVNIDGNVIRFGGRDIPCDVPYCRP